MSTRVHPTAIVEAGVEIGDGTAVWDHVHLRGPDTRIGTDCIIGEKTYIAYGVHIGNRVKINAFVYICTAVTIEDGVMVAAGTVFTNDRFPRAATPDLQALRPSEPDEATHPTRVCAGTTIGARAVIGCDLELGRWSMVGMGAVVTGSVPAHHLVVGCPARSVACVCRCGESFVRFGEAGPPELADVACAACGLRYAIEAGGVTELQPAT